MAIGTTTACGPNPCTLWDWFYPSQACGNYNACLPGETIADLYDNLKYGGVPQVPQPPGPNVPVLTGDAGYDISQTTVTGEQIAANVITNLPIGYDTSGNGSGTSVSNLNWWLLGAVLLGIIVVAKK